MKDAFAALESLSKLGKKEGDVKLGDLTLTLGTLDTDQESNVFISCAELTGNVYFYRLKIETLKYSLKAVNEVRLDDYLRLEKVEDREKLKKETFDKIETIVKTWDENVVSYLYSEWAKLSKASEEELKSKGIIQE